MAKTNKTRSAQKVTKSSVKHVGGVSATATLEVGAAVSRRAESRRKSEDRRRENEPVAVERRQLERREKVSRRRQIDPTTCEREYSTEEIEFMAALDLYKRKSGRMFPTCSEVLEVFLSLGYRKVAGDTSADFADLNAPHEAAEAPEAIAPEVEEEEEEEEDDAHD